MASPLLFAHRAWSSFPSGVHLHHLLAVPAHAHNRGRLLRRDVRGRHGWCAGRRLRWLDPSGVGGKAASRQPDAPAAGCDWRHCGPGRRHARRCRCSLPGVGTSLTSPSACPPFEGRTQRKTSAPTSALPEPHLNPPHRLRILPHHLPVSCSIDSSLVRFRLPRRPSWRGLAEPSA